MHLLPGRSHQQFFQLIQLVVFTAVTGWIFSNTAGAAGPDGATLVQACRCYACHHMTDNLLGPSYTEIAARHAARKDVMVEVLAEKIIVGGAGNWGVVPMVPNEHVSIEEARTIAKWILNLKD